EVVLLELGLVDLGGVEARHAVDGERRARPGAVRDLEMADEGAEHRAELARRVEDVLEVAEGVALLRVVVDGPAGGGRRDPDAVLQVVEGDEVAEAAEARAVLRA